MTAPALERRYARLLRLYPADYRRARGAEVLETLMESADGTSPREVVALVLGALRVRAGRVHRQSLRQSWPAAARAGVLMLLVSAVANAVVRLTMLNALQVIALGPAVIALFAAWRAYHRLAAASAAVAFGLTMTGPGFGIFWHLPLAVVLLLTMRRHKHVPVFGLLRYAPLAPLLLVATDHGLGRFLPDISGWLNFGMLVALTTAGLLWAVVDERVTMALGLMLLSGLLIQLGFVVGLRGVQSLGPAALSLAVAALPPAALLLASLTVARREARI
ncbi:hypothetical protein AB0J80_26060 [Actinoplanes sp. NPDC049548]|uniref:hypothetical protein n=1 Tax=Actinoplanes sp. NPDC049548 TaxID=3155152 RepID=UPI00343A6B89